MTSRVGRCRLCRVNALRSAALIGAMIFVWTPSLRAQDAVSPVPDPVYAPSDVTPPAEAVPMPDSDPGGDGSVVRVPIPGGGNVTVEGPDLPNQPLRSPTESWGATQIAPNSITGNGPLGPGPH